VDNLRVLRGASGARDKSDSIAPGAEMDNLETYVDAFAVRSLGSPGEHPSPVGVGATPSPVNYSGAATKTTNFTHASRAASMGTTRGGSRQPVTPPSQTKAATRPTSAGRVGAKVTRSDSGNSMPIEKKVERKAPTPTRPNSAGRVGAKVTRSDSGNSMPIEKKVERKAPTPTRPNSAGRNGQRREEAKAAAVSPFESVPRIVPRKPRVQPTEQPADQSTEQAAVAQDDIEMW
jgi:hypothetical protein